MERLKEGTNQVLHYQSVAQHPANIRDGPTMGKNIVKVWRGGKGKFGTKFETKFGMSTRLPMKLGLS